MAVEFKSNLPLVNNVADEQKSLLMRLLLEDIHRNSNNITPMKKGTLRAEVKKQITSPSTAEIEWSAPYAWYQERGYTTGPVKNYTTPGTSAHFAEKSVKRTIQNFDNIADLVKKI